MNDHYTYIIRLEGVNNLFVTKNADVVEPLVNCLKSLGFVCHVDASSDGNFKAASFELIYI